MLKMLEDFDLTLKRIGAWWNGEIIDRACISFEIPKPNRLFTNPEIFWSSKDSAPDLQGLVNWYVEQIKSTLYFGEALPTVSHCYGGRGTPMIMAAYLGGEIKFEKDTVWVNPVIKDWQKFSIQFDPENIWWKRSCEFFEIAVETGRDCGFPCLPELPDYGDSLTVFSLLRGTEQLLFDTIDNKEAIIDARDKFLEIWPKYHKTNWDVYRKNFPGDCSWLLWAPGKTYACQCDFSTVISPNLFIDLVVPEIEKMGEYLEYIVWHLDGPDEIKYLDILLDLPQIKAIQWVPGAGRPSAAAWIPMLKKIQTRKKSLFVYAENEEEIKILLTELSPRGLFISRGFTGKTIEEAKVLMQTVEKLSCRNS